MEFFVQSGSCRLFVLMLLKLSKEYILFAFLIFNVFIYVLKYVEFFPDA